MIDDSAAKNPPFRPLLFILFVYFCIYVVSVPYYFYLRNGALVEDCRGILCICRKQMVGA